MEYMHERIVPANCTLYAEEQENELLSVFSNNGVRHIIKEAELRGVGLERGEFLQVLDREAR
jgi:hypothetical protein